MLSWSGANYTLLDTVSFLPYPRIVMDEALTLSELAEKSGVSARTIRFYIARGVLDGPSGPGRGASYTAGHLARLEAIKRLQADGLTLTEIANETGSAGKAPEHVPSSPWWQHVAADDVIVLARADTSPWRTRQIRAAIAELAQRLRTPEGKE